MAIKRDGTQSKPGERIRSMHTFRAAKDENDHRPGSPRSNTPPPHTRKLLVESADYWYRNAVADDKDCSLSERLLWMENALNHTENALIAVLESNDRRAELQGILVARRNAAALKKGT